MAKRSLPPALKAHQFGSKGGSAGKAASASKKHGSSTTKSAPVRKTPSARKSSRGK